MFVELASILGLVDLVVAGDAILRVFKLAADDFRTALDKTRDYWSPAARAAAAYVRDEVDSPMESRLRMLLVLAGLPEPKVNHKLRDENGDVVVRFDLSYPDVRVIVEYEGRQHVEVKATWEDDLERREYLDGIEWRVIKVTARGVYVEPWRTIQRVADALRQRGVLVPALTQDWRPFFPGRRQAKPA
jgi:very-short-patch-repair endonuclease